MNIGLIGAANSHSKHFCDVLNGEKKFEGYAITHLYGEDDPVMAKTLCANYGLTLCASEEEVIAACDAIVITYRKGSMHYEPAMKALKAGKPLFNDKPFAKNAAEAEEIVRYAQEHKLLLCGGSNLKGIPSFAAIAEDIRPGSTLLLSYAADVESEYDGYRFYAIHSAELCLQICGRDFTSVDGMCNKGVVTLRVGYPDRQCIISTAPGAYDVQFMVANGSEVKHYNPPMTYQDVSSNEFIGMLKSRKAPRDYGFYVDACRLLDQMEQCTK